MKNKSVEFFDKGIQEVFGKAVQLISHGNKDYAEELLLICLEKAPELAVARKHLRNLQMKKVNSTWEQLTSSVKFSIEMLSVNKYLKKDQFGKASLIMERALCSNFNNKQAFTALAKIAKEADYKELVKEVFEYAVGQFPKDDKLAFALADACIKVAESKKAVEIMRGLLKKKPNSLIYQRKLQEANAVQIIDEKKWESDN